MLYIFKEYERITKKKDQLLTNDITQDLLLKILLSDDLNKSNDDLKYKLTLQNRSSSNTS